MFYIASALLAEDGLGSGRHSGVHALFGERFAKPGRTDREFHRFLLDAFDRRIQADYGFEAQISPEEVRSISAKRVSFWPKLSCCSLRQPKNKLAVSQEIVSSGYPIPV